MEPKITITGDGNAIGDSNTISVQKTTVKSGATMAEFTGLLGELRGALNSAGLDEKTARLIEADLGVIEAEVVDEKPSGSIISTKLKGMADMAKNAAIIGTAGTTLLPQIQQALEMLKSLFSWAPR